ncbi:hypothetical protein H5V45_09700 [Nocardioides sp. KIGAM211]|uniref:Uncharacterized protein n=1 Tax=Nocardioides luti TaxID=2761101 RepID=A0A7X0VAH3_9ACTN|nr:hypothetical protein [Nocardioides luti]
MSVRSAELSCQFAGVSDQSGSLLGHEAVGCSLIRSLLTRFHPGQRVTVASTAQCELCVNSHRWSAGGAKVARRDVGGYSFGVSRVGVLPELSFRKRHFDVVAIPDRVSAGAALVRY